MRYFYQYLFSAYPQKLLKTKFFKPVFATIQSTAPLTNNFSTFVTPAPPNGKHLKKQ